jgi:hypothetical protein
MNIQVSKGLRGTSGSTVQSSTHHSEKEKRNPTKIDQNLDEIDEDMEMLDEVHENEHKTAAMHKRKRKY